MIGWIKMGKMNNFNKTVCDFCEAPEIETKRDRDDCYKEHGKDESFKSPECLQAKSKFMDADYKFGMNSITRKFDEVFETADKHNIEYSDFSFILDWMIACYKHKRATGIDVRKEL